MTTTFQESQFTPTEWDTTADKVKFAGHFIRFVRSGFNLNLFHDWFYRRLSNTFSHIAHYNRAGFYEAQFSTTERRLNFLRRTAEHPCYGLPRFTYSDVESALREWVRESGLIDAYQRALATERRERDLAELARLKAIYETSVSAAA